MPMLDHISDAELRAYALGELPLTETTVVDAHLTVCEECQQKVFEQRGDHFLKRLAQAAQPKAEVDSSTQTQLPKLAQAAAAPAENVPAELLSLNQYTQIRELGKGGMGVVYLAYNPRMDREEVLKVVNRKLLGNANSQARFDREIRLVGKLNHPNVVTTYAVHQVNDLVILCMEFGGEDLSKILKTTGPLSVARACYCVHQAALGLQYAHERNLIHRDLKPGNLMVLQENKKWSVKILDFGLAKSLGDTTEESLSVTGQMIGTPAYMAPEQIKNAKHADIRADIYALGCTLFALLCGRPPFVEETIMSTVLAHTLTPPPRLTEVRTDAPEALADVIQKSLAKDPAARYQTPIEFAKALVPFVKAKAAVKPMKPVAAPIKPQPNFTGTTLDLARNPFEIPEDIAQKRPPRSRRANWLWALGAVGFIAFIAIVGSITIKTERGTIELTDLADDAKVFVDGEQVSIRWQDGKQSATISVRPGTHKVEVKKDGITVFGEDVTLEDKGRKVLTARLRPLAVKAPQPSPDRKGNQRIDDTTTTVENRNLEIRTILLGGKPMEFVKIPADRFLIGSPEQDPEAKENEIPQREVRFTKAIWVAKFPVTKAQFEAFVTAKNYRTNAETGGTPGAGYDGKEIGRDAKFNWRNTGWPQTPMHPVVNVSHNDAEAYCNWASLASKFPIRLLREAEYEYASRGGTTTHYTSGETWTSLAGGFTNVADVSASKTWACGYGVPFDDGEPFTSPVDTYKPNGFGLYDMTGNIFCWCADWYSDRADTRGSSAKPLPQGDRTDKVLRGCGWESSVWAARPAYRDFRMSPTFLGANIGFRVCFEDDPTTAMPPANPLPPKIDESDFQTLFNGKDIADWKLGGNPNGRWTINQGVLSGSSPLSNYFGGVELYRDDIYSRNFHLRVEATKSAGAPSPIRLFCNPTGPTSNSNAVVWLGHPNDESPREIGRLWIGRDHAEQTALPPFIKDGEFFTMDITFIRKNIKVEVNGVVVANKEGVTIPNFKVPFILTCADAGRMSYRKVLWQPLP